MTKLQTSPPRYVSHAPISECEDTLRGESIRYIVIRYLIVMLLLFITGWTKAQLVFGVKGGPIYSGQVPAPSTFGYSLDSVEDLAQYSERIAQVSYFFGATVEMKLGNAFKMRPGLTYISKSWKDIYYNKLFSPTGDYIVTKSTFHIGYLQVPFDVIYATPTSSGKAYIGAGIYYAYAIRSNVKYEPQDTLYQSPTSIKELGIKRSDFGFNSLLGYEFDFGLNFEAGYQIGMIPATGTSVNGKQYRIFTFSVGFLFR